MKKLTAILLICAMLLSLTACGDGSSKKKPETGSPDGVQAKEPDIPGTASPSDDSSEPFEEFDPTAPDGSAEPEAPAVPQPDETPADGGADEEAPRIMASHTDVSLFSAGETFRFTVWDSNGNDPDACTYTSADPDVAAVDETGGEITAVAPGMTTITAHVEFGGEKRDFDCIVRCRWSGEEPGLPDADAAAGTVPEPDVPVPEPDAPAPDSGTASGKTSLADFFSTLQSQYEGLGMMMAFDGELLENYYPGLSGISSVEEVLIQETAISMANIAVGLVRLSDGAPMEDILAVQSVLQNRITVQAEGGAFYPASCETWENGVITSVSNCVGMFVYPDGAQSMASLFTDTFGN